jgi:hypothetical protein
LVPRGWDGLKTNERKEEEKGWLGMDSAWPVSR